eukprot:2643351-Amphidinium_carterae.1
MAQDFRSAAAGDTDLVQLAPSQNSVAVWCGRGSCSLRAYSENQGLETLKHQSRHIGMTCHVAATCEDKDNLHLIMELVPGRDLFDKIVEKGQFQDSGSLTRRSA